MVKSIEARVDGEVEEESHPSIEADIFNNGRERGAVMGCFLGAMTSFGSALLYYRADNSDVEKLAYTTIATLAIPVITGVGYLLGRIADRKS